MSYFKQVLCYACKEAVALVNALSIPTAAEVSTYQIAGWEKSDFLSNRENFDHWKSYTEAKLFDGKMPTLAGAFVIDKRAYTGGADINGTTVELSAGEGEYAKNLAAYHWLAAKGDLDRDIFCANTFECAPEPTPQPTAAKRPKIRAREI